MSGTAGGEIQGLNGVVTHCCLSRLADACRVGRNGPIEKAMPSESA
jgi:hypothetical protein